MIYFFPMPYPDESLYSILVRYDKLTGNNSYYYTMHELFGNRRLKINFSFPSNLEQLCKRLPEETLYTPEYFIQTHTILPLYKPFINTDKYLYLENTLKSGYIRSALPIVTKHVTMSNGVYDFKYCPICIKEDKENYGEAYMHRNHQVDGNMFCNKHKSILYVYTAPKNLFLYDIDKLSFHNYTLENINNYKDLFLNISKDIEYLINNFLSIPNFDIAKKRYLSKLNDKGYIKHDNRINQLKLHKDFVEYFPREFLEILKSNIDASNYKNSWIFSITNKSFKLTVHPIRNILFIYFLFGDLKEFINYSHHIEPKVNKRGFYRKSHTIIKSQEYWNHIDNNYYPLAFDVIKNILENDLFDRITINLIAIQIKYNALYRNIHKMPKTQALIEKYKESIPEFHKRKIKVAIQKVKKEGKPIKPYKILRMVHIPPKYRQDYNEYINSLIQNMNI